NGGNGGNRRRNLNGRDELGRFTGGGARDGSSDSLIKALKDAARPLGVNTDTHGVDPLIDSFHEAKQLLSPIGRGAKFIGAGAKWSINKLRALKRREPLPRDEERHNRENERLLRRILDRISGRNRNGGGGGGGFSVGGLLGSLLGGGGGGRNNRTGPGWLSKLGKLKFLGPLATLLGAAGLALNWDGLDQQGKSEAVGGFAGGTIGATVGGVIGSIGGPVGTAAGIAAGGWLGDKAGEFIGGTAAPYIQRWTDSIERYNLPEKMVSVWKDNLKPFFDKLTNSGSKLFGSGSNLQKWSSGMADMAKDFVFGGDGGGGSDGSVSYSGPDIKPSGKFKGFGPQVDSYIKEASSKYGIDEKVLRGLVKMEDGWTGKISPTGATGVGQFTQRTWNGLARSAAGKAIGMTPITKGNAMTSADPRRNSRINTLATGLLAKENAATLRSYGLPVTGENLYMAHNMGPGFVTAVAGKTRFTSDTRNNMNVNGGRGKSPKQFMEYQKGKFLKHYAEANNVTVGKTTGAADNKASAQDTKAASSDKGKQPTSPPKPTKPNAKNDDKSKSKPNSGLGIPGFEWASDLLGMGQGSKNNFMPATQSFSLNVGNMLPVAQALKLPSLPSLTQRLDGGSQKPIVIQANNDNISQNVSDRGLAHAITGGLGSDRYWG
ncbi:MAG: hypothetical protein Q4P13_10680, partial [Psychrobacter sp.]|nr:hypothetical protein [Psychrobacter sp.]